MEQFYFAQPYWLLLLLYLLPMIYFYRKRKLRIKFSGGKQLRTITNLRKTRILPHVGLLIYSLAFLLLVLAMARPQSGRSQQKRKSEGLDMMLVVDASKSMLAMDFIINGKRRNRLDVIKNVVGEFIENRIDDRIGITMFGSYAFAYVPMTLDHDVLLKSLNEAEIGMAGDSTAIGDAVGVAMNRLKNLDAKSKVMILLTDGANQAGTLDPEDSAQAAKALGIKIYTIGVGSNGLVPYPTQFGYSNVRFELDEKLLRKIADTTGGRYFRATDTDSLKEIYATIDKLEKTEVELEVFSQYDEKFQYFLWPGFLLLMLSLMLRLTPWWRFA